MINWRWFLIKAGCHDLIRMVNALYSTCFQSFRCSSSIHSFFISTWPNKHKIKHIEHKAFDEKISPSKAMIADREKLSTWISTSKGFNISKIKHMIKNQGFSETNLMTMLLKQLVYMIRIFSVLEKNTPLLFFSII